MWEPVLREFLEFPSIVLTDGDLMVVRWLEVVADLVMSAEVADAR